MADNDSLFPALTQITSTSLSETYWEDDPTTTQRMELLLNYALCVIHNLSKSTKHRAKFRTPEMRKILEIYKGSPSPERRSFSMLAISYMADPAIDMSLLEDKYDAITDLTDYLDKSLNSGNWTGFSVQELVEGISNLAIHPSNKNKIIDSTLHLFYTILERNFDKKLTCYVRQILDGWGFSEAGCTTGSDQCQRETETQNEIEQLNDEANNSTEDIQMLDNLQGVLSECDSFGTDMVMEIIGAVKCIVSDKTCGRRNILKHMTIHEWPDLFIRILSDVWTPSKEVYIDDLLWPIILNTIITLTTYSDTDVEFAGILIEHGALELMQKIVNAYYQHLLQKSMTIGEKVSEYRGEHQDFIENIKPRGQSGVDKHQSKDPTQSNQTGQPVTYEDQSIKPAIPGIIPSGQQEADKLQSMHPTQTNVTSGELGTDELQSIVPTIPNTRAGRKETDHLQVKPTISDKSSRQPETDDNQSTDPTLHNIISGQSTGIGASYTFKPVSKYACVSDDSTIAYRKHSDVLTNNAVFVTCEPIESSKIFEFNIDKIDARHKDFSLEFGVCIYNDKFPDDVFYEGYGFGQGSGFWILLGNSLRKDFALVGRNYKLNLHTIHVNDRVGLVKHPNGSMGFLYNGKYQGNAFRNVPEGVYGLVATTGRCVQVSITGDAGTTFHGEQPADLPVNPPRELVKFRTFGTEEVTISQPLRVAYEVEHPEAADAALNNEYMSLEKLLSQMVALQLQASKKGYLNEIDVRAMLNISVNIYNTHRNSNTRVDPISKFQIRFITDGVISMGRSFKKHEVANSPSKETHYSLGLPERRKQVFDVVRPCFDNIQDMSGIVWTGSTSEGFAITDKSGPGTPYIEDEMDLMIPLAVATEDSRRSMCKDFAILKKPISGITNKVEAKENEQGDFKKECLITELENIGRCQQSGECPPFIWRPSFHAGYVSISIPESMENYVSESFTKHVCARSRSADGSSDLFLTRSKLLAIQEEYTRGRLHAIQSHISKVRDDEGDQFKGQLRLVQQGPVQTISVRYESNSDDGFELEFDQTVDVAIALHGVDWPTFANPWISRNRQWPEKDTVDKIIKDGYHIVPKYFPGGSGIDLEWRLSFSVAERTLARTFTDNQRTCYIVFKKLWRKYLKEPKVLSSYHIKTTMFWLCERTSSNDWTEFSLGERFLDLQNFLILFLQRHNVPNFFIPENNMISHVDPADVKEILAKAQDIRRRQQYYLDIMLRHDHLLIVFY
ncbi:uncharacterized protein LOC117104110 isoform X2 [Anneissia japonica]|uniref:uncharacterized protein LOC117104110 isoform X2 n=1 Tax=Anneissia japonica TaxID=1529436 RepID=UPI00142558EF|nr:uncharacterized protein LOC117104110 isoform X2 [Anneissia japonica]XP_033100665.1 uncharacterized protein LOC117104110 isoform X2 [Anneissia japonica]